MNVKTQHKNETAAQDVGTQPVASTERIVDARDLRHADVTAQARSSALLCASADGGDAGEEEAQRCPCGLVPARVLHLERNEPARAAAAIAARRRDAGEL